MMDELERIDKRWDYAEEWQRRGLFRGSAATECDDPPEFDSTSFEEAVLTQPGESVIDKLQSERS